MLSTRALSRRAIEEASPAVLRGLELFHGGKLRANCDGRASAGPLDVPGFLSSQMAQDQIVQVGAASW